MTITIDVLQFLTNIMLMSIGGGYYSRVAIRIMSASVYGNGVRYVDWDTRKRNKSKGHVLLLLGNVGIHHDLGVYHFYCDGCRWNNLGKIFNVRSD